jgi:hypothetical protein
MKRTVNHRAELDAYINVSDLLAYWQSKVRQFLRKR